MYDRNMFLQLYLKIQRWIVMEKYAGNSVKLENKKRWHNNLKNTEIYTHGSQLS